MSYRAVVSVLDRNSPFAVRLSELQQSAAEALGETPSMRFASAIYDPPSDLLHTFADNSRGTSKLTHYSAKLGDLPSLAFALQPHGERVVGDLQQFEGTHHVHTQRLLEMGYRASYARAVHYGNRLIGIIFVNSAAPDYFGPTRLAAINPFVRLAALHLTLELSYYQTFSAAITSAQAISAYRDTDTAEHLTRMSHYSAIIADGIAEKYGLADDFVAKLFQFAPMHDIGKVSVPDAILLKPGKLTPDEFDAMKSHVATGLAMVDKIIGAVGLGDLPGIDILRNTVRYHHEKLDGTGYPYGLTAQDIPIEAQILAVADIFDALTSHRPYKEAWPVERAFEELRRQASVKLNADCVEALATRLPEVVKVMETFGDRPSMSA
jgi:HD-GYP domain-containing protein (c-di-GMP phosphodiesterase class II)